MKPKIVLTRLMTVDVMTRVAKEFDAIIPPEAGFNADQTLDALVSHKADGLLFTTGLKFDAAFINRLPQTVKIAATCSVGFDHVDRAAAKARGVVVSNTPDVLNAATADLAFMLILGACRRAAEYEQVMRSGWGKFFGMTEMLGIEASGRTLGILGMGGIGQAVARRAKAFDMKVVYHNRTRLPADKEFGATFCPTLDAMLPHCQILSIHAPSTPETADIINARTLRLLPKGAVLVNTARGTLVDENALIDALQSGHLFAAGLDVFKGEPSIDPRFAKLPNVFLAPHMGSATYETRTAMGNRSLDNIAAVVAGKPAPHAI